MQRIMRNLSRSAGTGVSSLVDQTCMRTFARGVLTSEERRRKLLYRSKQRGFLELDVIMGRFAEEHLPKMTEKEMDEWEELLKEETPELFKWITKQLEMPEEYKKNPLFQKLVEYSAKPQKRASLWD